jgi:twitching motility two-component system response regulator PilG
LQLIELGQRTGELFVEAYSTPSGLISGDRIHRSTRGQSWFVFFLNGQIVYAGTGNSNLSRLRDFLQRYRLEASLRQTEATTAIASFNAPEYGHLWTLLENHVLTPAQGRSIIQSMVHETLFDLLSLHHGAFVFELSPALSPQLTTLEIDPLVIKIMKQVQQWKQFHPHIQSPDQCPVIHEANKLQEDLPQSAFETLGRWADGRTSIRQISRFLNRNIVTVARAIYPYVQQGLVQLTYASAETAIASKRAFDLQTEHKIPRIVCIDDGATVRKAVEYILSQHGYEATAISNPLKALGLVFQLKPDLILCDIAMPELDGYEICAMLRRSTRFRQTPIVMLTGKDGFIDRVRARMVGATDYLTKPFGENELLTLVERYVGLGDPHSPRPERLLAEALEDELEIDLTGSSLPQH